jgi:hypothetical protein
MCVTGIPGAYYPPNVFSLLNDHTTLILFKFGNRNQNKTSKHGVKKNCVHWGRHAPLLSPWCDTLCILSELRHHHSFENHNILVSTSLRTPQIHRKNCRALQLLEMIQFFRTQFLWHPCHLCRPCKPCHPCNPCLKWVDTFFLSLGRGRRDLNLHFFGPKCHSLCL